jgi:membrane-associated phospholipid phosphatase
MAGPAGGAALAFIGFLGLTGGTLQHQWYGVDHSAREIVGLARAHALDAPMQTVSILGDQSGMVPLIALASMLVWKYRRRWVFAVPIIMSGTGGLQFFAKWAVNLPRPNLAPSGFSSGHVLSLVVFSGLIAYFLCVFGIDQRWQWVGRGVGAGMVLTVAFSRLYLDFHWLSDVAGGFTLGLAYLLVVLWLLESFRHRSVGEETAAPLTLAIPAPSSGDPPIGLPGSESGLMTPAPRRVCKIWTAHELSSLSVPRFPLRQGRK